MAYMGNFDDLLNTTQPVRLSPSLSSTIFKSVIMIIVIILFCLVFCSKSMQFCLPHFLCSEALDSSKFLRSSFNTASRIEIEN